jgi:MFS family permease
LALALCGTGLSLALVPPTTNYLVEHYGWRGAYVAPAVVMLAIAFPLTFIFFRSAHDNHRKAIKASGSTVTIVALTGVTARAGFGSARFVKLTAAVTLFNLVVAGLIANEVPILIVFGLSPAKAAAVGGLVGIGAIIGRLAGGILLDRFDAKKVAAISVMTPCLTVALLLGAPGSIPATMAASLMLGLACGTELDACAYLAARHFGLRNFATLFGTINGLVIFASGLGPMLANLVFDTTRSYHLFLWLVVPSLAITALLFLKLGRYPDFDQAVEAAAEAVPCPPGATPFEIVERKISCH